MDAKQWAANLIEDKSFVILDVETTGIPGEIIQLAVCDHQGNELINTLIKPVKYEIGEWVIENIKITPEMVEERPTFANIYDTLVESIEGKTVIAYNVKFDRGMVAVSSKVNGMPPIDAKWGKCAMLQYVKHNPNKIGKYGKMGAWWKLEEAINEENIELSDVNFHDAMFDIRATLAIIQSMAGIEVTAFNPETNSFIESEGKTE